EKAADDAYAAAVNLQTAKQYDAAIAKYQEAITLRPKNDDYHYSLGTCYQQKGDFENAVKEYQIALSLNPKNKDAAAALPEATNELVAPIIDEAVKKQTGGDPAGAITVYMKALQMAPDNARGWTNVGTAYQQTDQYSQARDAYTKAYKLDPKNEVNDLYLIGVLDENSSNGPQALNDYQQYLKAAPSGQYAQAARERVKALSANPSAVNKLQTQAQVKQAAAASDAYNAGVKLQQEQKYDEAIAQYQTAIQADPKEPAYPYAIATAYQAKNDMDNAVIWYQKAVDLAPTNKDFKAMLMAAKGLQSGPIMNDAVAKHQAGDFAAAIELYKKALAVDPNNAGGYTNMAGAYQSLGDFNNARAAYQKAYDLDKKGAIDNLYFIGLIDENAGQGAKAKDDYMNYVRTAPKGQYAAQANERIKALTANPNATQKLSTAAEEKKSGEAQDLYSAAVKAQQENKFDEAIDSYKKAIAISPDASYYYSMGTAYQAKNDIDAAIEAYKTALSKSPTEATYKQVLKAAMQTKAAPLVDSAI
ncbi:MAG TPA: tetratricopeptide repeat protein, partial [Chroococcales cyanobacterium]